MAPVRRIIARELVYDVASATMVQVQVQHTDSATAPGGGGYFPASTRNDPAPVPVPAASVPAPPASAPARGMTVADIIHFEDKSSRLRASFRGAGRE
jgi:hypothetical protein